MIALVKKFLPLLLIFNPPGFRQTDLQDRQSGANHTDREKQAPCQSIATKNVAKVTPHQVVDARAHTIKYWSVLYGVLKDVHAAHQCETAAGRVVADASARLL
jgi:hypothetical protein